MSTAAVLAVLEHAPPWPSRTWKVAIALAERVDGTTSQAWPSLADLGKRAQVDRREVRRALRDLEDAGWITSQQRRAESGRKMPSVYSWHPPIVADLVRGMGGPVPPGGGAGPLWDGGAGPRGKGGPVPPSDGGAGPRTRTVTEPSRRTDSEPSTPSVSTTLAAHPQPVDNVRSLTLVDSWGDARACAAGHLSRHGWCRACRVAWPEGVA
jgi:hypothetical protein